MDNPSFRWIDSYSLFDIKTLKRKELDMKKLFTSIICIISLLIFSVMTPLSIYANDTPTDTLIESSDFDGEIVLSSYVESGDLYVVTMSTSNIPPGGGKCPSNSKNITSTVSRSTLQNWRDSNNFENNIRNTLAGSFTGIFSVTLGVAIGIAAPFASSVAEDCSRILDNTTNSSVKIVSTFTCTQKVQSGSWFHVWKLSSVKAY